MNILKIKNSLKSIKRTSFGISIPELRKFAKNLAKDDYEKVLDINPLDTFELRLLHAFVLGYAKDDINKLIGYFEKFIPYVDDWAVCDSLCQAFVITRKYPEEVLFMLSKLIDSKKEFESRIVSVILLSHYLNDAYIDSVFKIIDKLNTEEYYSRMGVAWAIATIMAKYPSKCLLYLQCGNNSLDNKTYNKSIQKINESYRVAREIKEKVKLLKK